MRPYFTRTGDSYTDQLGTAYGVVLTLVFLWLGSAMFAWFIANGIALPHTARYVTFVYWRLFGPSFALLVPVFVIALLWHPTSNELYWITFFVCLAGLVGCGGAAFSYIADIVQCSGLTYCSGFPELTMNSTGVDWPFIANWVCVALWAVLSLVFLIFINVMWKIEIFRAWLRYVAASSGDPYTKMGYGPSLGMFLASQGAAPADGGNDARAFTVARAGDAIDMADVEMGGGSAPEPMAQPAPGHYQPYQQETAAAQQHHQQYVSTRAPASDPLPLAAPPPMGREVNVLTSGTTLSLPTRQYVRAPHW
jgi:hypothetical protein